MKTNFIIAMLGIVSLILSGCSKTETVEVPQENVSAVTQVLNLTPDFISLSGTEVGKKYESGSTFILTISAGESLSYGFEAVHMEHIHIHVGDRTYMPVFPESGETSVESIQVEIEVPDGDFGIIACYSVQQQISDTGYSMYLEDNEAVNLYGVSNDVKYKFFDCYLLTEDAYVITGIEFRMGEDSDWLDVSNTTGCLFERSIYVDNVYKVTIRPDYQDVTGNITLRVKGEQHGRHSIVWENAGEQYLDLKKSVLPEHAIDGDTVTAELWTTDSYYLAGAECNIRDAGLEVINRSYIRFKMPSSDVTVTLDIREKVPVSYTASANIKEATFYDADDMYYGVETDKGIPGEKVYLFATAESGFKPMKATIQTGESFDFTHYAYDMYMAAVTIPEGTASLEAGILTAEAYTVSGNENIVFDYGNLYAEGENVLMSIYVPEGQRITSVTARSEDGHDISVELSAPYASFTMPASDVLVDVAYETIGGEETVSVSAIFDQNVFDVYSTTNYDWDFATGFTIEKGKTFYLSVYNYNMTMYYVGVKVGDNVTVYPAEFDEMMGEYSFGKALVADGDVLIKVGESEDSVSF